MASEQTYKNTQAPKKKKHHADWKMLYPILGILVFGAFALIAFLGVGYGIKAKDTIGSVTTLGLSVKLNMITKVGNDAYKPTQGLAIGGLVAVWVTIVIPFCLMFWSPSKKATKWLGILPLLLEVTGVALLMASTSVFIRDFSEMLPSYDKVDAGMITANFLIIIFGWLICMSAIVRGFYDFDFRKTKSKTPTQQTKNNPSVGQIESKQDQKVVYSHSNNSFATPKNDDDDIAPWVKAKDSDAEPYVDLTTAFDQKESHKKK